MIVKLLLVVVSVISAMGGLFFMQWRAFKDTDKQFEYMNNKHCSKIKLPGAPEDYILYKGRYIISAVNDNVSYFVKGLYNETPNGEFIVIDTQDPTHAVTPLPVEGVFPSKGVKFHPHGMYYDETTARIYVISHAYMNGGERIEVFSLKSETKLVYERHY